jgi:phage terminase large subunit-like protein
MPLHIWDQCGMRLVTEDKLQGRKCFAGLDLAATTDLAAIAYLFLPDEHNELFEVLWRCWTPEANLPDLDKGTGGKASVWAREGRITVTPGDWIDYATIESQIDVDATQFEIVQLGYDPWNAVETVQHFQAGGLDCVPVRQVTAQMNPTMKELMRMVRMKSINHGGDPVARWNADSLEAQSDPSGNIRPVKPDRNASGKRIDLIVALFNAMHCQLMHVEQPKPELWVQYT